MGGDLEESLKFILTKGIPRSDSYSEGKLPAGNTNFKTSLKSDDSGKKICYTHYNPKPCAAGAPCDYFK